MARHIDKRVKVEVTLRACTPVAVGGARSGAEADIVLARDGLGRVVVPASSLAGSLRESARSVCSDSLTPLFGADPGKSDPDEPDTDGASLLSISDGSVKSDTTEVYRRTSIDRWSGVAMAGSLRGIEALPRGSEITFELELEAVEGDGTENALSDLLTALEDGQVRIGSRGTRGWGEVVGTVGLAQQQDWASLKDIALPEWKKWDRPDSKAVERRELAIAIKWRPIQPIMVASGAGGEVDFVPLTSTASESHDLALVLPGSSLKGALRSRAEYIARTVGLAGQLEGPSIQERRDKDIEVPLVASLFGTAAQHDPPSIGRGAIEIPDRQSTTTLKAEEWLEFDSAVAASKTKPPRPEPLHDLLDSINRALPSGAHLDLAFHNAIDRWSGGVSDEALFNAIEAHGFDWEDLIIRVDLDRLQTNAGEHAPAALGLLWLSLWDLCNGWIPLGGLTARGFGAVQVDEVTLESSEIAHALTRSEGSWDIVATPEVEAWTCYVTCISRRSPND